jgi:hypothetical protein
MKNFKIALFVVLAAAFVLPSCKKGENDPFLSLHSRKARVVGEWKLTSGLIILNGDTTTYPLANYSETMEFKGDHTYKITVVLGSNTSVESGSWTFSSKVKDIDLKKKEAIILYTTSSTSGLSTSTYSGSYALNSPKVLQIDRLANKEMVVILDGTQSFGSSIDTKTGTLTYEQ